MQGPAVNREDLAFHRHVQQNCPVPGADQPQNYVNV